jgi:hypothetical protein
MNDLHPHFTITPDVSWMVSRLNPSGHRHHLVTGDFPHLMTGWSSLMFKYWKPLKSHRPWGRGWSLQPGAPEVALEPLELPPPSQRSELQGFPGWSPARGCSWGGAVFPLFFMGTNVWTNRQVWPRMMSCLEFVWCWSYLGFPVLTVTSLIITISWGRCP